ncbi:MAG: TOBE domain-containing protein, partial [Rhodospirillales bacterium]|nr:TOBE domain-containing protein [Rhodospirillales bacterium]
MNAGRAEQIGTPMDVYETPATAYVGGFIGSPSMNFLPGRIATDRRAAEVAGATLPLMASAAAGVEAGQAVSVGIRPEHLTPHGGAGAALALTVEMAEPLGADTLLHGRFAGADGLVTVRLPGHVRAAPGEKRTFAVESGQLHLFDAATGRRIGAA